MRVKKGTGILAKILLTGIRKNVKNLFVALMVLVQKICSTTKKTNLTILLNLKRNKLHLKEIAND